MKCQSCAMPIESGMYCKHCLDEKGELQTLNVRLTRMSAFMKSRNPELNEQQALEQAKQYMKTMPAWKDVIK